MYLFRSLRNLSVAFCVVCSIRTGPVSTCFDLYSFLGACIQNSARGKAHGEEALQFFKTDDITAILLGQVLEVHDAKAPFYRRCKDLDNVFPHAVDKTTEPKKHAARDGAAGPLPIDLHVNGLQRRDFGLLESQSLQEAFSALKLAIRAAKESAQNFVDQGHDPLLLQKRTLEFGTRFSGLGTCEEALAIMEAELPLTFRARYACDTNTDAQAFLQDRFASHHKGMHMYHDVMDLVDVPENLWDQSFADKRETLHSTKFKTSAFCHKHGKKCAVPAVDLDVSGTVCKDYSAQGKKNGTEGFNVVSMLCHFEDLRRRAVPIRLSENVVSVVGQTAIHSVMPDCDRKYIITMCEDVGFGSVRRDRGWLAGVRAPYRWIGDPNLIYQRLSSILAKKQIPQSELWWEDADGLQRERRKMSGRFRKFEPNGSLCLDLISYGDLF